ncbi:MAG: hypothetical protein WAN11_06210 [Syntrophobacteraceae bacterium]
MGVFDIFSKRQKKLRSAMPDVDFFDTIPTPLRVQIFDIRQDTLGNANQYRDRSEPFQANKLIVETLCREYGLFHTARGLGLPTSCYRNSIQSGC